MYSLVLCGFRISEVDVRLWGPMAVNFPHDRSHSPGYDHGWVSAGYDILRSSLQPLQLFPDWCVSGAVCLRWAVFVSEALLPLGTVPFQTAPARL